MKIVLSNLFKKQFKNLDNSIKKRVIKTLDKIALLKDPRSSGKALTGNRKGMYRYRVGDYRILCWIKDAQKTIFVVEVAHRSIVYS